jgi:histidyl-tRNA synthetase
MKAQMKYADRRQAPAAILMGEDEIKTGTVTIKDLDLGRELAAGADLDTWKAERPGQQTVPRDQMIAVVKGIIDGA